MCPDTHFSALLVVFHLILAFLKALALICLAASLLFGLVLLLSFFFIPLKNLLMFRYLIQANVPNPSPLRGSVINSKDFPLKETFAFL